MMTRGEGPTRGSSGNGTDSIHRLAPLDRSTNLDSWTLSQLRIMKVGGNASATDFFTRHGGSALLSSSDAKARYSSSVADRYKAELEKRKREDEFKCPEGIRIEGVDLNGDPCARETGRGCRGGCRWG